MENKSSRIFDYLALVVLAATVVISWVTAVGSANSTDHVAANDAVRIEIQRYMGYEILPYEDYNRDCL